MMLACRLFMLVSALSVAVSARADDAAYLIDKKDFERNVRVVVVTPVTHPDWLAVPPAIRTLIDTRLAERLAEKFELLDRSLYTGIRDEMLAAVRDPGDPATLAAVDEHSLREMLFKHRFDAFVHPRIVRVDVPFENDRSAWDGTKQSVVHKGRGKFGGKIAAASLELTITDRAQRPVYRHYGGIEVLMKRIETQFVPLAPDELFKDSKRAEKAVDIAISEL